MCKFLSYFFSSEDTWLSLTGLSNIRKILEYTKALYYMLVVFVKKVCIKMA
jgi:hypothetical protein